MLRYRIKNWTNLNTLPGNFRFSICAKGGAEGEGSELESQ